MSARAIRAVGLLLCLSMGTASAVEAGFTIEPPRIQLEPGATTSFTAVSQQPNNTGILHVLRWSATGGAVTGSSSVGTYVAGAVPGVYAVRAQKGKAGLEASAQVKIGYAPIAFPLQMMAQSGQATALTLTATDRDGDPLTYAVVTPPSHGAVAGNGAVFDYVSTAGYSGTDTFSFVVSDGWTTSAPAKVEIKVISKPQITSVHSAQGRVGSPFTYTITATNAPTSFTAEGLPAGLSLLAATGLISGTPIAAGERAVTLGATNQHGTGTATLALAVERGIPVITWAVPATIIYGAALSAAQLSATADVLGAMTYVPFGGAMLGAGTHSLTATFTPQDTANYQAVTASVSLLVQQAAPVVSWANPEAIDYGTALSAVQLNASASVPGAFTYTPNLNEILPLGPQALSAVFTPTDAVNYATVTANAQLQVLHPNIPRITFTAPAAGAVVQTQPMTIGFTVTCKEPIDEIRLDGVLLIRNPGLSYIGTVSKSYPEGPRTVHVVSTSASGIEGSATRSFVVDALAPVVNILAPVESVTQSTEMIYVRARFDTLGSTVTINGAPTTIMDYIAGGWVHLVTGNNTIVVAATSAGRTGTDTIDVKLVLPANYNPQADDDGDGIANANDLYPLDPRNGVDADADSVGNGDDVNDTNPLVRSHVILSGPPDGLVITTSY